MTDEAQLIDAGKKLADTKWLQSPEDLPNHHHNEWFSIPEEDALVQFLERSLWNTDVSPQAWDAARLSNAVYIYRERGTGWRVLVKFYSRKVGVNALAGKYADREFASTRRMWESGFSEGAMRVPKSLASWRGALFLEYVDGLTLEDTIAIRRSRTGTMLVALEQVARMLAKVHASNALPENQPEFRHGLKEANDYIRDLAKGGILKGNPMVTQAIQKLIERWSFKEFMNEYLPVYIHGDATSSNFIYPWDGGIAAVDWERMHEADPAYDLGRLIAEVTHSVQTYGGDLDEALPLIDILVDTYALELPKAWDVSALLERSRFYQAASALRIARNGWVPRQQRLNLVVQAMALLV